MSRKPLTRLVAAGSVVAALAIPATASAATPASTSLASAAAATQGNLAVKIDIQRFRATKSGTTADGTATATLGGLGSMPVAVKKKVHLAVARGSTCTILTLTLDTLDLRLLGLNVHLDQVKLSITGQRRGGVLGSLFCSLAGAKVKTARAAAAQRLNAHIRRTGVVRPLSFAVPVRAVQSQAPTTCNVLELTLGPLHLELLGLVVDLNKVHLLITADANGGVLGSLFCGLANTRV